MMQKTLLACALLGTIATSHASEIYNGRVSGMGGAGYASADFVDGVLYNPSLLARSTERDDAAITLNLGLLAQDQDEIVDNLDELSDLLDDIESTAYLTNADATELERLLHAVDDKHLQATLGANLVIALPTQSISAALSFNTYGSVSASPEVSDSDFDTIGLLTCATGTNPQDCPVFVPDDELTTEVAARGVVVTELGLTLAKAFELTDSSQLLVGVTPKRVEVETLVYREKAADFDSDDIDGDQYRTEGSTTGLDAGVTLLQGNLSYALTVRNLASKDFVAIDGSRYELATQSTAAVGYTRDNIRAEVALDLNAIDAYGLPGKTQMLRAGAQFSLASSLYGRVGYQTDLESAIPDAITAGFGLAIKDAISLDLAALMGSDDVAGVALQLGSRF